MKYADELSNVFLDEASSVPTRTDNARNGQRCRAGEIIPMLCCWRNDVLLRVEQLRLSSLWIVLIFL